MKGRTRLMLVGCLAALLALGSSSLGLVYSPKIALADSEYPGGCYDEPYVTDWQPDGTYGGRFTACISETANQSLYADVYIHAPQTGCSLEIVIIRYFDRYPISDTGWMPCDNYTYDFHETYAWQWNSTLYYAYVHIYGNSYDVGAISPNIRPT
jgi:hypothetical protein